MKEDESVNEENENEQPDEIQLVCALETALQKCVLDSVQQTDLHLLQMRKQQEKEKSERDAYDKKEVAASPSSQRRQNNTIRNYNTILNYFS